MTELEKIFQKKMQGEHYRKLKMQPGYYCTVNELGYHESVAIAYVSRARLKGECVKDLQKAIDHLEMLIAHEFDKFPKMSSDYVDSAVSLGVWNTKTVKDIMGDIHTFLNAANAEENSRAFRIDPGKYCVMNSFNFYETQAIAFISHAGISVDYFRIAFATDAIRVLKRMIKNKHTEPCTVCGNGSGTLFSLLVLKKRIVLNAAPNILCANPTRYLIMNNTSRLDNIATIDFETYSKAGYTYNPETNKWTGDGLGGVGVTVYSQHPSTDVLCMAYHLPHQNIRLWTPYAPLPHELFLHLARGEVLESWNVSFEWHIWTYVCMKRYGWPALATEKLRCAMAKSRVFCLPGKLKDCAEVLKLQNKKDSRGDRLIKKFSVPRSPSKTDARLRIVPTDPDARLDAINLYQYCEQDVRTEIEASNLIPDMSPLEFKNWQLDQAINRRGVRIDIESVNNFIEIIEQAYAKYNEEIAQLTNGAVTKASQTQRLVKWLKPEKSVWTIDKKSLDILLESNISPTAKRVLQIRKTLSSASVKKLYAMRDRIADDGRIHELFIFHSARTGRAAGAAVQPQNLPNANLKVFQCKKCIREFEQPEIVCPWCEAMPCPLQSKEWDYQTSEDVIFLTKNKKLETLEKRFPHNPLTAISCCLRSMFIAEKGHRLICSDYSAIEAVVLAVLSNEQWRIDVFKTHGKIYEASAAKISGVSVNEILSHKETHGTHHSLRKLGKIAELASGYQGWTGAWKNCGADKYFNSDEEIENAIKAWRNANRNIVKFWYDIERAAISAVLNLYVDFNVGQICFMSTGDILHCRLPSGREIVYHNPTLQPNPFKNDKMQLTYEGWNSNQLKGKVGWVRISTYGGKLVENIVQAVAYDILAQAIVTLESHGYPIVLHVHDEIVAEVKNEFGSLEEFERLMSQMPVWAQGWPIKASGGWTGTRYRK